jgi:hypothetical protein
MQTHDKMGDGSASFRVLRATKVAELLHNLAEFVRNSGEMVNGFIFDLAHDVEVPATIRPTAWGCETGTPPQRAPWRHGFLDRTRRAHTWDWLRKSVKPRS